MSLTKNPLLVFNVCKIQFALTTEVLKFLEGPQKLERIAVFSTDEWKELYSTANKIRYRLNKTDADSGAVFTHRLTLNYPGINPEVFRKLSLWRNETFIIKLFIEDKEYIMGNPENGARLTWDFSTREQGIVMEFSLVDNDPLFMSPDLDLFFINSSGQLIQQYEVEDEFTLNSDGALEVTGPNEDRYTLNLNGKITLQ